MNKNKIAYLILASFTMLLLINCKGNKGDKNLADNKDTIEFPSYEEYMPNEKDEDTVVDLFDSNQVDYIDTNETEQVFVEDKDGNLEPEKTETESKGNFYIIVGSFKVEKNANDLNKLLQKKGYSSQILPPFGQYNRVAIMSFDTRDAAKAKLPAIKNKFNDATFWILRRN